MKARARLSAEGSWNACRSELVALCERFDAGGDDSLLIRSEYLVAVGAKSI